MKYHISDKTGKPEKCSADKKPCPVSNSSEHYDSLEKANIAVESKYSAENNVFNSKNKNESNNIDSVEEDKLNFTISIIDKIMDKTYHYPSEEDIINVCEEVYEHVGSSKTYSELFNSIEDFYWTNGEAVALKKMYPHVIDVDKVINREDNLLNVKPDIDIHWSDSMEADIGKRIAEKKQYITLGSNSYYGLSSWEPDEYHGELVGIFNVKENSWEEFQGTFYEGDETKVGFEAELVYEDGYSVIGRMETGFGDMINSITGK